MIVSAEHNINSNNYKLFEFNDIHSHVPGRDRVLSVDFTTDAIPSDPEQHFTLGVHPWNAENHVDWNEFEKALDNAAIVGIGEAGLDTLRGPDAGIQLEVFKKQIELAQKHKLPLIIHSVKSNHEILRLKKLYDSPAPWIIHGFRGNLQQARQLIASGIHLSLGTKANSEVAALSSPFIHRESDEEQIKQ